MLTASYLAQLYKCLLIRASLLPWVYCNPRTPTVMQTSRHRLSFFFILTLNSNGSARKKSIQIEVLHKPTVYSGYKIEVVSTSLLIMKCRGKWCVNSSVKSLLLNPFRPIIAWVSMVHPIKLSVTENARYWYNNNNFIVELAHHSP